MLASHQIRPSPRKGRYLFHNRYLQVVFKTVDGLLQLQRKVRGGAGARSAGPPKRILVAIQAHIGDAILSTSVIPVLRAAYPGAELGFLIHPSCRDVFRADPEVQYLHTVEHLLLNRSKGSRLDKLRAHRKSQREALESIRACHYDLAIDLYPYLPNSATVLHAAGIPQTLGWSSGGFGPLFSTAVDWEEEGRHVVEWHQKLLAQLPECRPFVALTQPRILGDAGAVDSWRSISSGRGLQPGFVAIHVGAGAPHKFWPEDHWRALLERQLARGDVLVLLGHGSAEEELCHRLEQHLASDRVHNLSGLLTWPMLVEAIGDSRLLIGLDSACGHIAAARNVPSLAIATGITHQATWRPYSQHSLVVVHPTPCSPCYRTQGCAEMECIRKTSAEEVDALALAFSGKGIRPLEKVVALNSSSH